MIKKPGISRGRMASPSLLSSEPVSFYLTNDDLL